MALNSGVVTNGGVHKWCHDLKEGINNFVTIVLILKKRDEFQKLLKIL
jgi:hypothetical protein